MNFLNNAHNELKKMIEYFKNNYNLTDNQTELVLKLYDFLNSNCFAFLLKGYAGTGKTFMMKGLVDFLSKNGRYCKIAAPTGRAARVISQKTNHKAYTIHKTIYSSQDMKEFKIKNEDGTETFKFYYNLRQNEDSANTIYIIDEASMLSNIYSEGEFFRFGSGFLLEDLIKYINIDNNDHNKKIIFVGDNAQLPPVKMKSSPALDSRYLLENFNLESKEFELTGVVRQKAGSGILHNATKIRESLKMNLFNQIDVETNFKDITKTRELLTEYLQACDNSIDDETIIVAYSNSSVKEYNDSIRNHFFPNQNTITVGDKVLVVSNNYNGPIELLNGDFGFVKKVSPVNETRPIKRKNIRQKKEVIKIDVSLTFRDVEITFIDQELKKRNIECKIIENLLYSPRRDLSSDELKALYIDFKIRNPKLKVGTVDFKNEIRCDKYFNALRIKFGYAVTCHKAQGGEWKNVFLDCKTPNYFNSYYFRWLYTGITRAKENLFTIDEPNFKIDSNIQPPKVENIMLRHDALVLNTNVLDIEIPFNFPDNPFTKYIFLAIYEYLKDENISINMIRHTNWLEHYTFSQGDEKATFKVYYNKQNRVTTIGKPANTNDFTDNIFAKLTRLKNKTIIVEEQKEEQTETEFEFDQPFLREFYEKIKGKLEDSNLLINKVEHKSYHEIYEIKKNGLMATYKFWYNDKSIFKKTEIISSRTNGLTDEINKLMYDTFI